MRKQTNYITDYINTHITSQNRLIPYSMNQQDALFTFNLFQ